MFIGECRVSLHTLATGPQKQLLLLCDGRSIEKKNPFFFSKSNQDSGRVAVEIHA